MIWYDMVVLVVILVGWMFVIITHWSMLRTGGEDAFRIIRLFHYSII